MNSLSFKDGDTAVIVHCHAGCDKGAIVTAAGMMWSELAHRNGTAASPLRAEVQRVEVAAYPYVDSDGHLLYEVIRFQPKAFAQRRPGSNGKNLWNLTGVTRVLFRLPQVIEAARTGKTIIVCEGEKDVATLEQNGFVATTNAGGAGWPWTEEFAEPLRNAGHVVIIADNDEPGLNAALHRARLVANLGTRTSLIRALPRVGAHGDSTDFFDAGGSAEELRSLIASAETIAPGDVLESAESLMVTRRLAEIEPRSVRCVWNHRIFVGTFGLVAGEPGVGKSQFIGALVTSITRGTAPPGGGDVSEASDVLLLALEDDPAAVLRPRYEAMGADLQRVHIIEGVRGGDVRRLTPFGLNHIELLERKLGEMPSIKTIVIDPIASAMGGVDAWRSNEVRERLNPFLEVTDRRGVTVVGVTHTNKGTQQRGTFRVEGSLGGFVGRARWVAGVGRLEDGTRGIGVLKSNLGPTDVPVVTFTIDETGRFAWIGETSGIEASSLFNPPASEEERDAAGEARDAILGVLSEGGDVEATTLLRRLKDVGHSEKTIERQRAKLKRAGQIERLGGGVAGPVRWRLRPLIAHTSHSSPSNKSGDQWDHWAISGARTEPGLSRDVKLCRACKSVARCCETANGFLCESCISEPGR